MTKAELLDRTIPSFTRVGFAAKLHAFAQLLDTEATAAMRLAFNALLAKLDADGTVNSTDYVATLTATADTIGAQFVALCKKLDADSGVADTNYEALHCAAIRGTGHALALGLGASL